MTRLLISTAIAGLLALGGSALAQGDDHNRGGHAAAESHPQGAPQGARPQPAPQGARPEGRGADNRGHEDRRPSAAAQAAPAAAPAAPNAMRGPAAGNAMRGPDNRAGGPGNRGGHQDFSSYRRNFSAPHHYRAPTSYRRPSGWYAHRWTFGEILPSLFWAQDYWLSDYNEFGLMPPPPGTVWVRDGDDALLIDRDSGEIIQVEYSVFY